jgi:hypothetical protein
MQLGLNEADTYQFSSILIYSSTQQSVYLYARDMSRDADGK